MPKALFFHARRPVCVSAEQVSQPTQPCWKLSRSWHLPDLAVNVQKTRSTGWYLLVLQEGHVKPGAAMELVDRPYPEFSIEWANQVMFAKPRDRKNDLILASCPLLSDSWRSNLQSRSADNNDHRERKRLQGGLNPSQFGWKFGK